LNLRRRILQGLVIATLLGAPWKASAQEAPPHPADATQEPVARTPEARTPEDTTPKIPWHTLRYEARKLFFEGHTEVRLEQRPREEAAKDLSRELPDLLARLDVDSEFAGRKSTIRLWLEPQRGDTLGRIKRRLGAKAYEKTWQLGESGISVQRLAPADPREAEKPPSAWSQREHGFLPLPKPTPCPRVTTPSALFYLLATHELAPGEELPFCSASNRGIHLAKVQAEGKERLQVRYRERSADSTTQLEEEIEALHLTVRTEGGNDGDELDFLGLEGEIELFLHPEKRLLLEVRGKAPVLGKVQVQLREVELRAPTAAPLISSPGLSSQ
jgi:hypothetical protein